MDWLSIRNDTWAEQQDYYKNLADPSVHSPDEFLENNFKNRYGDTFFPNFLYLHKKTS